MRNPLAPLLLGLALALPAAAEESPPPKSEAATVDGTLKALYDVISGPAGQARDWGRFRSLFAPGAVLTPTGLRDGKPFVRSVSVEGYIERSEPILVKDGFFEREIHRSTKRYGNVLHAFSTYESRHKPEEPPFARGINSIQLVFDGGHWFITAIAWSSETPENPIPKDELP